MNGMSKIVQLKARALTTATTNSLASAAMLRSLHGVRFPWRWNGEIPRIARDELSQDARSLAASSWLQKALRPLQTLVMRSLVLRFIKNNLGDIYYPDLFLIGAAKSAKSIVEALSFAPNVLLSDQIARLDAFYASAYADRIGKEFSALGKLHNVGLEILVGNAVDAEIANVSLTVWLAGLLALHILHHSALILIWPLVQFGPKRITQQQVMRIGQHKIAMKKRRSGMDTDRASLLTSSYMEGCQVAIDVHIKADTAVTLYRINDTANELKDDLTLNSNTIIQPTPETINTSLNDSKVSSTPNLPSKLSSHAQTLFHEYSPLRTVAIRFQSPYFEPSDTISQSGQDGMHDRQWDWDWQVADIDYLLTSEQYSRDQNLLDENNEDN